MVKPSKSQSDLEYIRQRYGVPAYPGVKVQVYDGRVGTIRKGDGGYIGVTFPEKPSRVEQYHPTWEIKYFVEKRCVV
ncbi:hypothetical protein FTO70_03820 [Methanosarcina sp. KYL-1]|uniref:hypothetical protein n=1 Tax=Methanosarcina sp. KYL-1 TaxID=2602068 RepID=UPI00210087CB|nr:hypothetical protein [Methanosarcina sp. KYL-1]MCQ1534831.1 hypothetical protein [Methanosarcina sp. KYL-1]